jgi:hypothetical protein
MHFAGLGRLPLERVSPQADDSAFFKILSAALMSASLLNLQRTQLNKAPLRDFASILPQREHVQDVPAGSTKTTVRAALSAFSTMSFAN